MSTALNDLESYWYRREVGRLERVLSGTFSGTGQSESIKVDGKFNVTLSGGSGIVDIERSFDAGSTWNAISKNSAGEQASYDVATFPFNGTIEEPEYRTLYRLNCTSYISGTITYRIGQ